MKTVTFTTRFKLSTWANFNGILIKFKPPNQVAEVSWQLTLANKEVLAVKDLARFSYRSQVYKQKNNAFCIFLENMNHPFTEVFLLQTSTMNVQTRIVILAFVNVQNFLSVVRCNFCD